MSERLDTGATPPRDRQRRSPEYQLLNTLDGVEIRRIEVVGRFANRAEARQHMIDTADERKLRDSVGVVTHEQHAAVIAALADARKVTDDMIVRGASAVPLVAPTCSLCRVAYVEDYVGRCQEFARHATDAQLAEGRAPKCPGIVAVWPADVAAAALRAALGVPDGD